jgi:glucokinase
MNIGHNGEARYAIGLDIGGTKIAAGVVTDAGRVAARMSIPTPRAMDSTGTLGTLLRVIAQLREKYPAVEAVGVGAAGMVDWPSGNIRWAPNNKYSDLPLRALLAARTALPAVVDNDANVAAWAEARFGSAAGYSYVAFLTVGTGIGAGLIINGHLYRGASGIAAEAGHIIVDPSGDRCGCGNTGCLEAMASGSTLGRRGRQSAERDPHGKLATFAGGAANVTGETVLEVARGGDALALSLFSEIGYWLGIGIASLVTLLEVELVVVGGGLSATGDLLLAPTRSSFEQFVFAASHRSPVPIVLAQLGADAGLIGAALLALEHLDGSQTAVAEPIASGAAAE